MKTPHFTNLVLFTASFPYGEGEQFIETEIKILAKNFKTIYLFPLQVYGFKRELPSNVIVVEPKLYLPYNRLTLFLKNIATVAAIFNITISKSRHRLALLKRFKSHLYFLLHRINGVKWLESELDKINHEKTLFYSYWFNLWTLHLSIIKYKRKEKFNFITRIHNGDFDEVRANNGFFPFREFELTQVQQIYAVSQFAIHTMKLQYPTIKFNISLSRLGVSDLGNNPFIPFPKTIQVVSCSFFSKIKRVHLIIDILSQIKNSEIKWTHFGSGKLEDELIDLAKKKLGTNIKIEFKGLVPNSEVIEFYKNTPVDLFINTSELEGIPVSMMEAISFGIPIVGCSICGVPEIANETTGLLIPKELDAKIVADQITNLLNVDEQTALKKRQIVKEFWAQNYNAVYNYNTFIKAMNSSN